MSEMNPNNENTPSDSSESGSSIGGILKLLVPLALIVLAVGSYFAVPSVQQAVDGLFAPSTVEITGTVSFKDGEPLKEGQVRFIPVNGAKGEGPFIDFLSNHKDGTFKLYKGMPGNNDIPVGEYVVTISANVATPTGPMNLISDEYADSKTTPLTAKVTKSNSKFDFTLEGEKKSAPKKQPFQKTPPPQRPGGKESNQKGESQADSDKSKP